MTMPEKSGWQWLVDTSLRWKIQSGQLLVGTLLLLLLLLTYNTLQSVQEQIGTEVQLSQLLNAILETRRYEKNLFLYRKPDDLSENDYWRHQSTLLLNRDESKRSLFHLEPQWQLLKQQLEHYDRTMEQYVSCWNTACDTAADLEEQVRHYGKEIVSSAEAINHTGNDWLQQELKRHRRFLLWSAGLLLSLVVAVGWWLSRTITRPLQWMEQAMQEVTAGKIRRLDPPFRDREFRSLTAVFNRMLAEIKTQQRELVRSEKLAALGTMLAGVAHELNNPLSNIATSCQILLEEPDVLPFQRDMLGQIDNQTLRARDIVRTLLDVTRKHPLQRQPLVLATLLPETIALLQTKIVSETSVHCDVAPELTLSADKNRLQQALLNLIQNALDALVGTGVITIHASIATMEPNWQDMWLMGKASRCHTEQEWLVISVRDNGVGMTEELLQHIFDPFFTTKEIGHGIGLGLFIVWEVVEEHGGCLLVESEPGRGSCFRLLFPYQCEQP
ncbi:MAG: HAMP domain-containing histidine kinase [Magnetococcales bacterium]|nr:HAMP domain-containing histidine kinase [Magnetococcales bacterium]